MNKSIQNAVTVRNKKGGKREESILEVNIPWSQSRMYKQESSFLFLQILFPICEIIRFFCLFFFIEFIGRDNEFYFLFFPWGQQIHPEKKSRDSQ